MNLKQIHFILYIVGTSTLFLSCPNPFAEPPKSSNADLSSLTIDSATINPVFSTGTTSYTVSVPNTTTSITVTGTKADANAVISDNNGVSQNLTVGDNNITIKVTAQNGTTTKNYVVMVNRAKSSNADLSSLTVSAGNLIPIFNSETKTYKVYVTNLTTNITVTGIKTDTSATISSNSGEPQSLNVGVNDVTLKVTAEDGTTINNYSIEVNRENEYAIDRTFQARASTDSTWYTVPATLRGTREHVLVYVQNTQTISNSVAQAIADEFELSIYNKISSNFGNESDVDNNGKIIFLLLDIVDGFSGSGGYVAGYFDATNMFSTTTYVNSNMADMIFLDVAPAVAASASFYETIAHEFQHLVNFANTVMVDGRSQDIWINEGLSSGAEYIYSGNIDTSRINYYNADPLSTIRYGNTFFVWNGYWEQNKNDTLANYSSVYLFFQWLRIHSNNSVGIYKDILSSTYRDYRSVLYAAYLRMSSTLSSWEKILGTWFQANLLNNSTGLKGYIGEITLSKWFFNPTNGITTSLSPGEGVSFNSSGGQYAYPGGSGSYIRYQGLNTTTQEVDTVGPTYIGDLILVFNADSNYTSADQNAILPEIVSQTSQELQIVRSATIYDLPTSYPVDVHFLPGNGFSSEASREGQFNNNTPVYVPERNYR